MEKLSVIIATIDDSIATNLTMAQIIMQLESDEIPYEIILVDNGSNDDDKENLNTFLRFHQEFPIRYFEHSIKGTIPPHSFGVTKAEGKYITLPDPHLTFSPHYFRIMIKTLQDLKNKDVEVVFSPFGVGSMAKKGGDYVCGSDLMLPNPFGKTSSIGPACKMFSKPFPVLSNTMSSCIMEKEWMLKIGNMFPEAFEIAGGYTAESLLIGITTWMFGKKCYIQPKVVVEHPVYRCKAGARSANTYLSMATGAYIIGGDNYLKDMPQQYGEYLPGQMEEIKKLSEKAREYINKNTKFTLKELIDNWEKIKNEKM